MHACKAFYRSIFFTYLLYLLGGLVENVSRLLCNEALWNFVYTPQIPHAYPIYSVHFEVHGISSMPVLFLGTCFVFSSVKRRMVSDPSVGDRR